MKIKKMYQGTAPENKILNIKKDSQTDAYSCDYINNLKKTIYTGRLKGEDSINLENVKRFLDIYFRIDFGDEDGCGKYTIDTKLDKPTFGSGIIMAFDSDGGLEYYVSESSYTSNILTHNRIGFFNISNGTYSERSNHTNYYIYRIDTYE